MVGIYTCCLQAAAASAAQAMTSYLWGTVSDHTGRKVCPCHKASVRAATPACNKSQYKMGAVAACTDGGKHLSMFVHSGPGHGAKLQRCHSLPLRWGSLHFKHWSVSYYTLGCPVHAF